MPQSYINWRRASVTDIAAMTDLSYDSFIEEQDHIYKISVPKFKLELAKAILTQEFDPRSCLVVVSELDGELTGWFWLGRGGYTTWSEDELAEMRFIHVDQHLPAKYRVKFVTESLEQAELWARMNQIPVLASASVNRNYEAFLRLHEKLGYTIQACVAYKRIAERAIQLPDELAE